MHFIVISDSWFVLCLLMASLNSCVNPWIYMAFSGHLMRKLLPCCSSQLTSRTRRPNPPRYAPPCPAVKTQPPTPAGRAVITPKQQYNGGPQATTMFKVCNINI